ACGYRPALRLLSDSVIALAIGASRGDVACAAGVTCQPSASTRVAAAAPRPRPLREGGTTETLARSEGDLEPELRLPRIARARCLSERPRRRERRDCRGR